MLQFNATFIVAIISFVVFIIIMNFIFYKPILKVIEDREKFINDNYDEADSAKKQADLILQTKDESINKAYTDAKQLVSENRIKSNNMAQDLITKTKTDTNITIDEEKNKIEQAKNSTYIDNTAEELSDIIVNKIFSGVKR